MASSVIYGPKLAEGKTKIIYAHPTKDDVVYMVHKDGITAAVLMAEVAALAAAEGVTLQDRLDAITATYGRHVMAEKSLRMAPADGAAAVARLRAAPPTDVGGHAVTAVEWFEEAGLLRLSLGDSLRLQVRPSGTEPKVKLYGEGIDCEPAEFMEALAALLV